MLVNARSVRHAPTAPVRLVAIISSAALGIAQSWVLGPFMLIPGLATANGIGLMLWVRKNERKLVLLISPLAMLVPLALQLAGLASPFYRFENGLLIIAPHAFELPAVPTLVMLTLAGVGTLLVPAFAMLLLRDALDEAQRQLSLQRWTLEQLGGRKPAA
jgi:hypothetical protein